MHNTNGIVLRSIKYGETSLIVTVFTEVYGIQAFMAQGIRSTKGGRNRAGLLQPTMMLEIVMNHQQTKSLQRMKEFQPAYLYQSVQQDIVKNTVALFSVEVLLRLLPEEAPFPELYEFTQQYFTRLDTTAQSSIGNYPLFFIIMCSRFLGYEPKGNYSEETPHLNLQEGGFTDHPPAYEPFIADDEGAKLNELLLVNGFDELELVAINGTLRLKLLKWYISFLQTHTQHMGNIKSLAVLQAILH